MDLERIEASLRAGPVDEPLYVPGSFRSDRRWGVAMAFAGVGAVLVIGIVIGLGVGALRQPTRIDVGALGAHLEGSWVTNGFTQQQMVDALLDAGYDLNDVNEFASRNPGDGPFRYELKFDRGELTILIDPGTGSFDVGSGGPYRLMEDGSMIYTERTTTGIGLGDDCMVTTRPEFMTGRLEFGRIQTQGCSLEERIAHASFFNFLPYGLPPP
jgi:hypothetical protein